MDPRTICWIALSALASMAPRVSFAQTAAGSGLVGEDDTDELCRFGHTSHAAGQYTMARRALAACVGRRPTEPDGHFALARVLSSLGETGPAIAHYDAYLTLEQDPVRTQWARGEVARLRAACLPSAGCRVAPLPRTTEFDPVGPGGRTGGPLPVEPGFEPYDGGVMAVQFIIGLGGFVAPQVLGVALGLGAAGATSKRLSAFVSGALVGWAAGLMVGVAWLMPAWVHAAGERRGGAGTLLATFLGGLVGCLGLVFPPLALLTAPLGAVVGYHMSMKDNLSDPAGAAGSLLHVDLGRAIAWGVPAPMPRSAAPGDLGVQATLLTIRF